MDKKDRVQNRRWWDRKLSGWEYLLLISILMILGFLFKDRIREIWFPSKPSVIYDDINSRDKFRY